MNLTWKYSECDVDWNELSNLYRIAPLGEKKPDALARVFSASLFKCFIYDPAGSLVGVGRALADGADCSYICDIAVHPDFQGAGVGGAIVSKLIELSQGHKKIILYANPGKEAFYRKLGFRRMSTAMAIFENLEQARELGLVSET